MGEGFGHIPQPHDKMHDTVLVQEAGLPTQVMSLKDPKGSRAFLRVLSMAFSFCHWVYHDRP